MKTAIVGANLARNVLLSGGLIYALNRFSGNSKLVTGVGLGAIGVEGFARGAYLCTNDSHLTEGAVTSFIDVTSHALDVYCFFKVANLLGNRASASLLKQVGVFGGVCLWGAARAAMFYLTESENFAGGFGPTGVPIALFLQCRKSE